MYVLQKQPSMVFLSKSVLKICSKFTGEHRHGCSPVNLQHIFRALFPKNTSGWLLLYVVNSSNSNNLLLSVSRIKVSEVYMYNHLITRENFWSGFWINQERKLLFLIPLVFLQLLLLELWIFVQTIHPY